MVIFLEQLNFNSLLNLFYFLFFKKKKINLILFTYKSTTIDEIRQPFLKNISYSILKIFLLFSNIKIEIFRFDKEWRRNTYGESIESELIHKYMLDFKNNLISNDINFKKVLNLSNNVQQKINIDFLIKDILTRSYLYQGNISHRLFLILNLKHYFKLSALDIIYFYDPIAWNDSVLHMFNSNKIIFYKLKNLFQNLIKIIFY